MMFTKTYTRSFLAVSGCLWIHLLLFSLTTTPIALAFLQQRSIVNDLSSFEKNNNQYHYETRRRRFFPPISRVRGDSIRRGDGVGMLTPPKRTTTSSRNVKYNIGYRPQPGHWPQPPPLQRELPLKDCREEASNLFGNIRIPAALFAKASADAAFAMPGMLTTAATTTATAAAMVEGLELSLVKRLYVLLMMGSLSNHVLAIVISTLTVGSLSMQQHKTQRHQTTTTTTMTTMTSSTAAATMNVAQLIREQYELEWIATRLHFLSGVVMFILGIGLRMWVSISIEYRIISRAILGIILSTTLLCAAFMRQDLEERPADDCQKGHLLSNDDGDDDDDNYYLGIGNMMMLPLRYLQLLRERSRHDTFFLVALCSTVFVWGYIVVNIPHVVNFVVVTTAAASRNP